MIPVTDVREVPGGKLRAGDHILYYEYVNEEGKRVRITTGRRVVSTRNGITIAWDDGKIARERLPYDCLFAAFISEEEFIAKYEEKAAEVMRGLLNIIPDVTEDYSAVYDNEWLMNNPYETAKRCLIDSITVLGYVPRLDDGMFGAVIGENRIGKKVWWKVDPDTVRKIVGIWAELHPEAPDEDKGKEGSDNG